MKYFKAFPAILFLAAGIAAQDPGYNYPAPPQPPRGTYLPPSSPRPPPINNMLEENSPVGIPGPSPNNPDGEHEPGMPFDFTYAVKDDVGNDFSHNAQSNGDVVKGEYKTLLPDGRVQVVRYTADWKNGYNAEVTYEGEARPEPPTTRRPINEFQTSNDAEYVTPPTTPRTTRPPYVPPQTTRPPYVPPQTTRPPYVPPQTTRPPYVPPYNPPPTNPPPPRITTTRQPYTQPPPQTQPPKPPGLYGAPEVPFGVRNNPKFGYQQ